MIGRILAHAALIALLVPAVAAAQERPALEIGTKVGFSISRMEYDGETETLTQLGVPTGALYLALFPSENIFVEPELAFNWMSSEGSSLTTLGLAGWFNFAPAGVTVNSVYFGAAPALRYARYSNGESESESQWGAAGRIGYRSIVRNSLAVRFEAGFTRFFESDDVAQNVFTFQVGFGGLLNRVM